MSNSTFLISAAIDHTVDRLVRDLVSGRSVKPYTVGALTGGKAVHSYLLSTFSDPLAREDAADDLWHRVVDPIHRIDVLLEQRQQGLLTEYIEPTSLQRDIWTDAFFRRLAGGLDDFTNGNAETDHFLQWCPLAIGAYNELAQLDDSNDGDEGI